MVGKTYTDEMAYSLNGENVHYGTPTNPRAPGRIPGGSSSGSAVAVAGSLVDFALGTDCGGSVRLPASYCGIFGIRTTHGLVPADGVVDLAASFDTVGWFAREPQTLRRVGEVLLPAAPTFVPTRLLIADDAFAFAGPEVSAALADAVDRLKATFTHHRHIQVYTGDPAAWSGIFRVLQGSEIWRRHGAWIDAHKPSFGPGIAERFRWTRTIDPAEVERMRPQREGLPTTWRDSSAVTRSSACQPRRASRPSSRPPRRTLKDSVHAPLGCCRSPASPACRRSRCRSLRWEAARWGSP